MKRRTLFVFLLSVIGFTLRAQISSTTLFQGSDATSNKIYYRIPALTTCKDGSILAICDERLNEDKDVHSQVNIRLVARKSYDNGNTWSEPFYIAGDRDEHVMAGDESKQYKAYSDAAVVVDKHTGTIVVFCTHGCNIQEARNGSLRPNLVRIESTDNGQTWSKPTNITSYFFGSNYTGGNTVDGRDPKNNWCYQFFPSGRVLQLRDGRLAVAMFVSDSKANISIFPPSITYKTYNYLYMSDDLGKTWQLKGNCAMEMGDEAKLEELEDGRLMISSRLSNKAGRGYNYYDPKTERWGTSTYSTAPVTAQCNGEIKVLTSKANGDATNRMLFSIPNNDGRKNISLFYSYDEGKNWVLGKSILPGDGAYSTLTVLPDKSIGILFEENFVSSKGNSFFKINFARITLEELTQHTDYLNVTVSNSHNPLQETSLKGVDGKLKIEADATSILENYTHHLPVVDEIEVYRTFSGSKWHTISFPFDVKQVSVAFSDDNHEIIHSMLTAPELDVDNMYYFNLQTYQDGAFKETDHIKANTPYLIRIPVLSYDINLKFVSEKGETIFCNDLIERTAPTHGARFLPAANNLNQITQSDALVLNGDGTAFEKTNSSTIYPFEAYMTSSQLESVATPSLTNSLPSLKEQGYHYWCKNQKLYIHPYQKSHIIIYNINGQIVWNRVIDSLTEISLPKGVYIINNNQKVIL